MWGRTWSRSSAVYLATVRARRLGVDVCQPAVQVLVDGDLGRVEREAVAATGQRVGQGGLGLAAGGVAAQGLEGAGAVGAAGQLEPGVVAGAAARALAGGLGVTLDALALQAAAATHRCWRSGSGGGEQVQQGLFGDADAAADADRAQLTSGDRLVELVAPDPKDRGGLADGEYLGQRGQCAGGTRPGPTAPWGRRAGRATGGPDRESMANAAPGPVVRWPAGVGLPRRRRGWDHTSISRPGVGCFPWWEGSSCGCWPRRQMGQAGAARGRAPGLMRSSPRQPGSLLPIRDTGAPPAPASLPRVDNFSHGSDACRVV